MIVMKLSGNFLYYCFFNDVTTNEMVVLNLIKKKGKENLLQNQ